MIITVILILTALVALNFLLLFFSCNKTSKIIDQKMPRFISTEKIPDTVKTPKVVSNPLQKRQLAPTGS